MKCTECPHRMACEYTNVKCPKTGDVSGTLNSLVQLPELETMTRNRDALCYCLEQLVSALPTKRDWLDPDLEKQCKTVLRICN